ncbi:MAG: hypothetical protein IJX12_05945, partial [Lachnospiraceae bacterium]|nr:hypothetical protein [Lachnospiraceae bacterium]
MNFRIVKALYKKEILDVLRDKKTVIMMLIVPLILYPLMIVVGLQLMTKITTDMSEQNYTIGIGFEEDVDVLKEIFQKKCEEGHSFTIMGFDEISQFNEGGDIWSNVDAFIERVELEGKDTFVIHYLSADTNSGYATDLIIEVLNDYSLMLTTSILEEAGLDSEYVLNPVEIAVKDNSTTEES